MMKWNNTDPVVKDFGSFSPYGTHGSCKWETIFFKDDKNKIELSELSGALCCAPKI